MFSRRPLYLLSLLALFLALTQANRAADGVIFARADAHTDSVSTTQPPPSSPTSSPTVQKSTTAPTLTPSTTTTSPPSTTTVPPTTSPSTSATVNTVSTSSTDDHTTTTQPSVTPTKGSVTPAVTTGGSLTTSGTSSSSQTTSSTKSSSTASAQDSSSSQTGISTKTKNTIVGVVVGVAGAILLAGLSIVAWRIWGRKRRTEESDGLMGYSNAGASQQEKTGSMTTSGASPFQSTLENYHNPTKNVNASSNF